MAPESGSAAAIVGDAVVTLRRFLTRGNIRLAPGKVNDFPQIIHRREFLVRVSDYAIEIEMRCCRTNCCPPNDRNRFGNSHRTKPIKSYSPTNYLYPGSSCPAFSCRRDVCSLEKKNSGNKTTNKLKMFSRRSIASCPKARRKKVSRRGDGESYTIFRLSSILRFVFPAIVHLCPSHVHSRRATRKHRQKSATSVKR